MPCYSPPTDNIQFLIPQWLCQAFRKLSKQQIIEIQGLAYELGEGWQPKDVTAYQWYIQHLKDENDLEELKRITEGGGIKMTDIRYWMREVEDLIDRNIGEVCPISKTITAIILQALKDKDVRWLRGRDAAAMFKALGFDSIEFMDMAEPMLHLLDEPVAKKEKFVYDAKYQYLRDNKDIVYQDYLRLKSLRAVADKYEVCPKWLRAEILSDVKLLPHSNSQRYYRIGN